MKSKFIIFFSFITILIFSGCSVKEDTLFQSDANSSKVNTTVSDQEYQKEVTFENKIQPNDRVSIFIYIQSGAGSQQMNSILTSRNTNTNTLNQENVGLLVTQDGTVRLPLIGATKITGYTEDEASKMLIKKYKKYIRNPYITVEILNQRVVVVGEVQKPGIVPVVNGTMNLLEALSRSGGLKDLADRSEIKIIRGDLRHPNIRTIDLTKAKNLTYSSLILKPNDIVYAQPRKMKGINKAFNEAAPFWNLLGSILTPFVQVRDLHNWNQ